MQDASGRSGPASRQRIHRAAPGAPQNEHAVDRAAILVGAAAIPRRRPAALSGTRRLFAAIEFDAKARRAIGREQTRIRRALGDATPIAWVRPDQMHLTLVFLAAVPEQLIPALTSACAAPVPCPSTAGQDRGATASFSMTFGGVGVFPLRGAPRVLWLNAIEGAAQAARVQQALNARIEDLGIPTERQRFRPHVTLGRWRHARAADRARIEALTSPGPVARLEVSGIVLYESRLSSSGSTYLPLVRAPLCARP